LDSIDEDAFQDTSKPEAKEEDMRRGTLYKVLNKYNLGAKPNKSPTSKD